MCWLNFKEIKGENEKRKIVMNYCLKGGRSGNQIRHTLLKSSTGEDLEGSSSIFETRKSKSLKREEEKRDEEKRVIEEMLKKQNTESKRKKTTLKELWAPENRIQQVGAIS
ncbi:hypothetical protein RND81_07G052400 [Saponaria officinalis]|uniref:Uncharacterized protein n=1 Tax=Saponaria officinalis TaxID=3572 RepID=A0AAW1JKM3_SAPOF